MRRIKLVVAVVAVMVAMIAVYAFPAVAHNNDGNFSFNDNRDNNNVFRFDANDLFDFGCLGVVIEGECFGITTFDGNVFDNNGDFLQFD